MIGADKRQQRSLSPWGGGARCNVGGTVSCWWVTLPRGNQMRCGVGGTGAGRGAMSPWGGGARYNVGGEGSCWRATSPRGGQMRYSAGRTGAGRGAMQLPTTTATVMATAKMTGMVTMALITPYKNEWNDSAQKGQMPPLGKMCYRKQTS